MRRLWRDRTRGSGLRSWAARGLLVALVTAILATIAGGGASASAAPVREIGLMKYGFAETASRRMAVDSVLHRGFYTTNFDGTKIQVYDLKALKRIGSVEIPQVGESFTVDEANHRVFYRPTQASLTCGDASLFILDSRQLTVQSRPVPCYNGASFFVRGMSYYAPENKLYVIGATAAETILTQATGTNSLHESTIIRQLDGDTLELEWEADASSLCDTNSNTATSADPVVGRSRGGVISYCYVGRQGRALWIPMRGGEPVSGERGEPVIEISPTIGRATTPIIDQPSGRLLILEDAPPFGPAVYVYDPENARFYGVIPSGVSLQHQGVFYDFFRGFSDATGRLYILNRTGLVMADVRADPLPTGVSYPVLTDGINQIYTGPIAVDGRLGRLFFGYPQRGGFVVVEDAVPPPPTPPRDDPDAGTADIPEVPGKTGHTFSGAANAFGVHVLNTGGLPRLINNADILCTAQSETFNDRDEFGRCPADRVITPGNREYFVAQTTLESGSDSGAAAFAAAVHTPSNDTATDSDVRSIGRCMMDRVPDEAKETVRRNCPNGLDEDGNDADPEHDAPLEDYTAGSQGRRGRGAPFAGALCVDFAGSRTTESATNGPVGESRVACDAAANTAESAARASAVMIAGAVPVLVAHSASTVLTEVTGDGVVTTATATVSGIDIGGQIVIGRITTTAVSKARGRSGTTLAHYDVALSDVRGSGIDCAICDRDQVVAAINELFGAQMRARAPDPYRLASRKGYQGLVQKDPKLLQSDRAVNDDDTITVNGLDLIFYNDSAMTNPDGSAGRSRIVLSLAGVEAESRYGIYLLPEAIPDDDVDFGSFDDTPGTDVLGEQYVNPPGSGGAPAPSGPVASGPGELIVRSFAFVRTRPGEFAMLFVLWSLLAAPVYLGVRRRAMARALDR